MRHTELAFCVVLGFGSPAFAIGAPVAPPNDLDALELADKAPATTATPAPNWRVFIEGAATKRTLGASQTTVESARASIDARFETTLAPGLRVVFSDRLDLVRDNAVPRAENVNTLRELYLSWARTEAQAFDIGRLNVRHGGAIGFNPTDWFKEDALRSVVSPDPAVLRENRQGTVVLQAQQLWASGGITATFSPKLTQTAAAGTFALNAGATNPINRWLLAGSLKVNENLNPEFLLYGGDGIATQLGLNLSGLVSDSVVVFGEFSAGNGLSLIAQSLNLTGARTRQQRAALGLTYTTSFNLSFTAEAEYNSAAPNRGEWKALAGVGPVAPLQLIGKVSALQDLPVRRATFFHLTWKDAIVRRLDLSGFVRFEASSDSRAQWVEARYRWDHADLALQWQLYSGDPGSVYRTVPLRKAVDLAFRYYFQ